jgi:hypothetical protein
MMKMSRILLVALSFAAVFMAHMLWDKYGQSSSPWRTLPSEQSPWLQYVDSGKIWLGLSYGLAAAFTVYCLTQLYQYRKRAVAGTVGGLTLVGFLYAAGCFLLGCCGSPMLAVYVGLFGSRFAGFAKPFVFGLTSVSVGIGYILITRKMAKAGTCCQPTPQCPVKTRSTFGLAAENNSPGH